MKRVRELTVESCQSAYDSESFWLQLVHREKGIPHPILGEVGMSKKSYFAYSTNEVEEGTKISIDLSDFTIEERSRTIEGDDGFPKEVKFKYLVPKVRNIRREFEITPEVKDTKRKLKSSPKVKNTRRKSKSTSTSEEDSLFS